jgi:hypothetical protein
MIGRLDAGHHGRSIPVVVRNVQLRGLEKRVLFGTLQDTHLTLSRMMIAPKEGECSKDRIWARLRVLVDPNDGSVAMICSERIVRQRHSVLHQEFVRQPSYQLPVRIFGGL